MKAPAADRHGHGLRRTGRPPRRRGRRRPRARRRLRRDDRARPRLDRAGDDGRDADAHARRHARRVEVARDRGHAVRLVPGLGRGRRAQRDPLREGGRRGRREARGRRRDALARARSSPGYRSWDTSGSRRSPPRCSAASRPRTLGRGARPAPRRARARGRGRFSLVLEAVPAPVAARITGELAIPTIGIGAGADCDGQVLVWHDLLGLYEGRSGALRQALRRRRRHDPRRARGVRRRRA